MVLDAGLQIERRREDKRPRLDDAEGVRRSIGVGADGVEPRFPFLQVAGVELESRLHLVA